MKSYSNLSDSDGEKLVNTARAELLDHRCLLHMLEERILRGAALDVLPGEPSFGNSISQRLIDYSQRNNNLIITPHIAGSTQDAWKLTQDAVINTLLERIEENG